MKQKIIPHFPAPPGERSEYIGFFTTEHQPKENRSWTTSNALCYHLIKVKEFAREMPDWVGEIHDARCRFEDITFDSSAGSLSIRCWQLRDAVWEELLVIFEHLTTPPTISRKETLPYYELSTVYFEPSAGRVYICFHAGLSIQYSSNALGYSFCGSTGRRRSREEMFV